MENTNYNIYQLNSVCLKKVDELDKIYSNFIILHNKLVSSSNINVSQLQEEYDMTFNIDVEMDKNMEDWKILIPKLAKLLGEYLYKQSAFQTAWDKILNSGYNQFKQSLKTFKDNKHNYKEWINEFIKRRYQYSEFVKNCLNQINALSNFVSQKIEWYSKELNTTQKTLLKDFKINKEPNNDIMKMANEIANNNIRIPKAMSDLAKDIFDEIHYTELCKYFIFYNYNVAILQKHPTIIVSLQKDVSSQYLELASDLIIKNDKLHKQKDLLN